MFGDITGKLCYEAYRGRVEPCEDCMILKVLKDGKQRKILSDTVGPNGQVMCDQASVQLSRSASLFCGEALSGDKGHLCGQAGDGSLIGVSHRDLPGGPGSARKGGGSLNTPQQKRESGNQERCRGKEL